jgi:hypothetical protein
VTQSGHGGPWTPDQPDQPPYPRQPQPEENWHGAGTHGGAWDSAPQIYTGTPGPGPLPPETPAGGGHGEATQYLPPVPSGPSAPQGQPGQPGQPGHAGPSGFADEAATQYIQPIPAADAAAATQFIPPVPAGDQAATQYLPPVPPQSADGPHPPQHPAQPSPQQGMDRDTQMLRRVPAPGAQPAGGDAEATQYLPPVPGGYGADENRQPPAEFDNLFRSDASRADYGQSAPGGYDPRPAAPAPGRRGGRIPLLAAAGVGIVVLGIGIGSLMDGGEDKKAPVASDSQAPSAPQEDPGEKNGEDAENKAREQAVALDKLLADSGDSRTAVVGAVENVKRCDKLGEAAQALRGAAQQRADLVTRLNEIKVDQLPDHAALTTALTKAWQASKSADEHYAGWADQVAGDRRKFCKHGRARNTPETGAAAEQSGIATQEKQKASDLWNRIAKEWNLTERRPIQL